MTPPVLNVLIVREVPYPWRISGTPIHFRYSHPFTHRIICYWYMKFLYTDISCTEFSKNKNCPGFYILPWHAGSHNWQVYLSKYDNISPLLTPSNMTIYLLYWHLQITTPTVAKVISVCKRHVLDIVRNACRHRNDREDMMQIIFVPA